MPNPEEYRRVRRVVDLLLRVTQQPRRWTRRDLAALYEVSEKQVDKDLQLVRHGLRMPLRHVAQGYYFERVATLPSLTLTLPEALSLLLAARLGQQMPGVSRADLSAAIARVEAMLPVELLPLVGALGSRVAEEASQSTLLGDLQLAIAERARLRLVYQSASRGSPAEGGGDSANLDGSGLGVASGGRWDSGWPKERLVDPYTLLPYLKSWYLVGMCHLRGGVRMFKVDRIRGLSRTGDRFPFPAEFDLEEYLGHAWGLLRGEAGDPEEVVLEFEAETGRWVRDEEWHPSQRVEELPNGRVRLTYWAGITSELRRWVLGFGRQVRVVRPEGLGKWVREEARRMVIGHAGEPFPLEVRDGG